MLCIGHAHTHTKPNWIQTCTHTHTHTHTQTHTLFIKLTHTNTHTLHTCTNTHALYHTRVHAHRHTHKQSAIRRQQLQEAGRAVGWWAGHNSQQWSGREGPCLIGGTLGSSPLPLYATFSFLFLFVFGKSVKKNPTQLKRVQDLFFSFFYVNEFFFYWAKS